MDPAELLPYQVFEEILSLIGNVEVKKLIFVNKLWYKRITSSCNLVKNDVLAIRNDWINDDKDLESIIECGKRRNFHSILLSDCSEMYEEIYEIISTPKCSITMVTIFDMKFQLQTFIKFIKSFESTVRYLKLHRVEIENDEDCEEFHLKNLKDFNVAYCSKKNYLSLLQNTPKLASLELGNGIEFDEKLISIIKNLKLLKKLTILNELLHSILANDDLADVKFCLTDLKVFYTSNTSPNATSIEKFLQTQASSLEKIDLDDWLNADILKSVLTMKNLKELSLLNFPFSLWSVELPQSSSIEILDIRTWVFDVNCEEVKKILAAVPNARELKMRSLNEEVSQFVEENLKNVTTISLVHPSLKYPLPRVSFD